MGGFPFPSFFNPKEECERMENSARKQPRLATQRDLEPLFVKIVLAVLLVLGFVMIFGGVWGIKTFHTSGYDT